jgi:3',5'-cyclic AMP phosphodiesterase CpdA
VPAPRTLILRFVDFDDPTIALHDEILHDHGQVWWGWWKKSHEAQRHAVLESFASTRLPSPVGLVNRREGTLYRAQCVRMELAGPDENIPSPDPAQTPAYYRSRELPTWFLFQEIEPIEVKEWEELTGGFGIPEGDDTLYVIDEVPAPGGLGSSATIPKYEAKAPGETILHISDPHFGDDHGFSLEEGKERHTMREIIREGVRASKQRVGVLVISGDLTTQANLNHLQVTARDQIAALAEDLELELSNVVVIPGNHDIKLIDADPSSYAHELGFRFFLNDLFGADREPEGVFSFETPEGRTLNLATLNSMRLSSKETRDYGYVGVRSKLVFEALTERNGNTDSAEMATAEVFNFAVLHHHLVSGAPRQDLPEKRPLSLTLDAGRIIAEAQAAGVHAAIHGHEHLPFIGTVARQDPMAQDGWDGYRRPLAVIGGGSAGAKQERLPEHMRDNTYGLYTPQAGGNFEFSMYRFNNEVPPNRFTRAELAFAD